MKQFTLIKVGKMGEYDEEYGQVFWCDVSEDLRPVRFQKKLHDIPVNSKIFAETAVEKPGKKGAYLQLTKVQVDPPDGSAQPSQASTPTSPQISWLMSEANFHQLKELLEDNNRLLKKLVGEDKPSDEEINLDDIPF